MRVLVAFDKFKDALTAREAGEAAAGALRAKHPDWELDLCPLTDGGEGFCETLTFAARGRIERQVVSGPRGGSVNAPIGFVPAHELTPAVRTRLQLRAEHQLAVIEVAAASGLALLAPDQRDPWLTTSLGTGEQIMQAAQAGADAILIGAGGSATNDLGLGALSRLGYVCRNLAADLSPAVPRDWPRVTHLDPSASGRLPRLFIACDVISPLLGPDGATATFGPQKGLKPDDILTFEALMSRMAAMLCDACGQPRLFASAPGAGAAGGIAFGLMVACDAKLVGGYDLVSVWLDLAARLAAADLVITGEGRFDATSLHGKGPGRIVTEARRLGKTVHVFAGSLGVHANEFTQAITPAGMPLDAALPRTAEHLAAAVARTL